MVGDTESAITPPLALSSEASLERVEFRMPRAERGEAGGLAPPTAAWPIRLTGTLTLWRLRRKMLAIRT